MSLDYIRTTYRVPAKRGQRIRYTGGATPREGVITSAAGARLRVRLDGDRRPVRLHPTWEVEYLGAAVPEGARHG